MLKSILLLVLSALALQISAAPPTFQGLARRGWGGNVDNFVATNNANTDANNCNVNFQKCHSCKASVCQDDNCAFCKSNCNSDSNFNNLISDNQFNKRGFGGGFDGGFGCGSPCGSPCDDRGCDRDCDPNVNTFVSSNNANTNANNCNEDWQNCHSCKASVCQNDDCAFCRSNNAFNNNLDNTVAATNINKRCFGGGLWGGSFGGFPCGDSCESPCFDRCSSPCSDSCSFPCSDFGSSFSGFGGF